MPPKGIVWSQLPWPDIIPRIVLYAHNLLRRRPFAGVTASAEDLAWSAIEKTLSGTRRWDPERIGLLQHLMGTISSDVYNHARKEMEISSDILFQAAAAEVASQDETPEEEIIRKNETESLLKYLQNKDETVAKIASIMILFGINSTPEIANIMQISVSEMYNLKKRLRRYLSEYERNQQQPPEVNRRRDVRS